jgi:pyruvate kinase
MPFRHSKIVCTIGPASCSPRIMERLFRAGMDVARLNFSHGSQQDHAQMIKLLRASAVRLEKPIAILADLQGPKIRTGALAGDGPVELREGQTFVITTARVLGDSTRVSTIFKPLPREVHRGDRILLSDGLIELRVQHVRGREVICRVVNGGQLGQHKGINLPGVKLHVPALTSKDRQDLGFALKHGANYIAVSFVRRPEDIVLAKSLIRRAGKDTPVIAKLEKPEAIDNLDEILAVADCVMVARGDLGVEMNPEKVPVVQKRIISKSRDALVPVITATQMLDSMQKNPRPTRAEASDVANAVFDGSDALMLSGETAAGLYPLESVVMMDRIIAEAEASVTMLPRPARSGDLQINEAIAEAICHAAEELKLKVVAVFTESGSSAGLVSKYRPRAPIVAFSPMQETRRRLSLYWGVLPRSMGRVHDIDKLAAAAEQRLLEEKLVKRGDIVGVVAGTPLGTTGSTNLMRLLRIGG